jgi:tetratricopeptide (TPR) repeat protein
MRDDRDTYHLDAANWLEVRYGGRQHAPEGWRETLAWHLEQAGAFTRSARVALEIAELAIARLDFLGARQWTQRMLELFERAGPERDDNDDVRAYTLTMAVLEFGGQYREALDYARKMLRAARNLQNRSTEARALLALGRMQRELGQLGAAEMSLIQARALIEHGNADDLDADIRFHLAKVFHLQGRIDEALHELKIIEEQQTVQDDHMQLARVLTSIGDIYRTLAVQRETLVFYNRALSIEQGRGNLRGQGILREKLALTLASQNKLDAAMATAQESLRLRQMTGDIIGQARSYSVLGTISNLLRQPVQAMAYYEQSRLLDEQTQNLRGQGNDLLHIGDTARALKRYEQARTSYTQALSIAQHMNDNIGLVRVFERLGEVSRLEGKRDEAQHYWIEALKIRDLLKHDTESNELRKRLKAL